MIIYLSYILITLYSVISRQFFRFNFQIYNKLQYKNIIIFIKHIE